LQVRHLEVCKRADAAGYAQVVGSGLAAEEHGTTIARAGYLALAWIEQMLVDRRKFGTAELATFRAVGEGATAGNLP
jgi:hypothetical protein